MTDNEDNDGSPSVKLLLHCEGGMVPHMTRVLWDDFIKCHPNPPLILGVELADAFATPMYRDDSALQGVVSKKVKRKRATMERCNESVSQIGKKKLIGYSFQGKDIRKHLGIPDLSRDGGKYKPPGVMIVPSYDLFPDTSQSRPTLISTSKNISILTSNGHVKVFPDSYFSDVIAKSFTSDLRGENCHFVTLHDEFEESFNVNETLNADKKRKASITRTINWNTLQANLNEFDHIKSWASVVGGSDLKARTKCLRDIISGCNNVEGVTYVGLHRIAGNISLYKSILGNCQKILPQNLKSCILETKSVEEIFVAFELGVNVIGSSLPQLLAKEGKALIFSLSNNYSKEPGQSHSFIDLKSPIYARDKSPISETCQCMTCRRHSVSFARKMTECSLNVFLCFLC